MEIQDANNLTKRNIEIPFENHKQISKKIKHYVFFEVF